MSAQTKHKAIRINKTNKKSLESQFGMSDDFLEFSSGLYIIAEFGDQQYHSILTNAGLEANYTRTGRQLANGFFELDKKPVEPIAPSV